MALIGAMATFGINLASGNINANGNGTIVNGGTTGGGGGRASSSTRGPLPIFNQVVEFFHELRQNYQGVRIENLQSL